MSESLGRTLLYTVGGMILGSFIGPFVGYLGQSGRVNFNFYAGIGFALTVGVIVSGIMGVFSNGIGGMITGMLLGIALGGGIDYAIHPPPNVLWGWAVGASLGLIGGLVAGMLAPPETKIRGR